MADITGELAALVAESVKENMNDTCMICDGNGNQLADGIPNRDGLALARAKELATHIGAPVYIYEHDDTDDTAIKVYPCRESIGLPSN